MAQPLSHKRHPEVGFEYRGVGTQIARMTKRHIAADINSNATPAVDENWRSPFEHHFRSRSPERRPMEAPPAPWISPSATSNLSASCRDTAKPCKRARCLFSMAGRAASDAASRSRQVIADTPRDVRKNSFLGFYRSWGMAKIGRNDDWRTMRRPDDPDIRRRMAQ